LALPSECCGLYPNGGRGVSIHGANPFADMSRLIVGSVVWVILIMIALLLIFFMYIRMSNR